MPFESLNLGKLNSGKTVRAIVRSVTNNRVYNNTGAGAGTTEVWDDASVADYAIVVAELGTSGIYAFNTPSGVNFEYVFDFYEAPGGTIDLTRILGGGYGKARVIVESYGFGAGPAELILANPANQLQTDAAGGVTVNRFLNGDNPDSGVIGVPTVNVAFVDGLPAEEVDAPFALQGSYQAVLTNPRYQTRNMPPMAQGSEPTDIWAITDPAGTPIDLTGKSLRFVAYLRTDPGTDQESRIDDTVAPAFKYETGDGITLGGAGHNEVTLHHMEERTSVPGVFEYFLWNVTDRLVLAKGRCPIEPAVIDVLV